MTMVKKLHVSVFQLHGGMFLGSDSDHVENIIKDIDQEINIGREKGDLGGWVNSYSILSRRHGKIFVRKGVIIYEDTSTYGTTILHWEKGTGVGKSEFVHDKDVVINPGDWILITSTTPNSPTDRMGVLLIPSMIL